MNLLSNALKYTLKGQIILGIKSISENEIEIRVEDTGIGIL